MKIYVQMMRKPSKEILGNILMGNFSGSFFRCCSREVMLEA